MPARRTKAECVNNIARTYQVDQDLARELRVRAAELGVPQSQVINAALSIHLAKIRSDQAAAGAER